MKTYICKVEGLLMSNPAVILHTGQKLIVESDTTEIFQALKAGKLEEVKESGKNTKNDAANHVPDAEKMVTTDDETPMDPGDGWIEESQPEVPEVKDTASNSNKKNAGKKPGNAQKGSDKKATVPFL